MLLKATFENPYRLKLVAVLNSFAYCLTETFPVNVLIEFICALFGSERMPDETVGDPPLVIHCEEFTDAPLKSSNSLNVFIPFSVDTPPV